MKPLVVVGSANADFVLQVDRLPAPGETVSASELDLFPGGKGANQAAAASRLGHETHFIGQCGKDANGDFLRKALEESGVRLVGGLKTVEGCGTGSAYIFLQPSGENSIVILGGANQKGAACPGSCAVLRCFAFHGRQDVPTRRCMVRLALLGWQTTSW